MPTPTKGPRLGGSSAHQRHILSNLATALFEHGRITTTEAKARRLRPVAERLITFAKRGDLHARRRVLTVVNDKGVVHSLFTEIGPGFAERAGGYTRITKIGPRKGDNAPMAVIELVRDEVDVPAAPADPPVAGRGASDRCRHRSHGDGRGHRGRRRRCRVGCRQYDTADEAGSVQAEDATAGRREHGRGADGREPAAEESAAPASADGEGSA